MILIWYYFMFFFLAIAFLTLFFGNQSQVRVQSDPAGRLVISGEPEHPDNPWGVTPFKKVQFFIFLLELMMLHMV